jgi:hypothetical protein
MFTVRRSLCVSTRANLHATTSRVRTTRRPGTSVSAKRDAAFFPTRNLSYPAPDTPTC